MDMAGIHALNQGGIDAAGFQAQTGTMPVGFESEGKVLVADFRANEKFHLLPISHHAELA